MSRWPATLRLVHLSDIHVWRYATNPLQLFNKRLWGMGILLIRRARKFRLERLHEVVERVSALEPDHILITGDLTTTALPAEFRAARSALAPLLEDASKVTILPGNHDRYTVGAHRKRDFESQFGEFAPRHAYPWLRRLDRATAILGLDPTRAGISARGHMPAAQMLEAQSLIREHREAVPRLVVACHYPLDAPPNHRHELHPKRLVNADQVRSWLGTLGAHLLCCGHVHAAWCFVPEAIPNQLSVNAGAPLLHDESGDRPPGFLEIVLDGAGVRVDHHAWNGRDWLVRRLHDDPRFFDRINGQPPILEEPR